MTTDVMCEPGVQLDRKQLLAALRRVGAVIATRTSKPILQGVHLEASGGVLRLRGTDLDVSIAARVPGDGFAARTFENRPYQPQCELFVTRSYRSRNFLDQAVIILSRLS